MLARTMYGRTSRGILPGMVPVKSPAIQIARTRKPHPVLTTLSGER